MIAWHSWAAGQHLNLPLLPSQLEIVALPRGELSLSREQNRQGIDMEGQKKQCYEEGLFLWPDLRGSWTQALKAYPFFSHWHKGVSNPPVHLSELSVCRSILGWLWGCPVSPGSRHLPGVILCAHRAPWPDGVGLAVLLHSRQGGNSSFSRVSFTKSYPDSATCTILVFCHKPMQ